MRHFVNLYCFSPFVVSLSILSTTLSLGAEKAIDLNKGQMYLIFDPRLQGKGEKCELKVHQFRRHPLNPIVKPEHPWEAISETQGAYLRNKGRIQVETVLWEPENQLFKMWYFSYPGKIIGLYATSTDGIHWEKPSLGLCEYEGSKNNNIWAFGEHGGVIYRDRRASDPNRRYVSWAAKSVKEYDYSLFRYFSRDGLHWKRQSDKPALAGNEINLPGGGSVGDVAATFWFPRLQKHVCFFKNNLKNPNPAPHDQPKNRLGLRTFIRLESTDGIKWNTEKPTWVLNRDEKDKEIDEYIQFYGLTVHPVGDFYLAFPWLYHSNEGDFDIGLAYSTDTVHWERPFRGKYVLPKGADGEWDRGMQLTATCFLIEKDGLWWLYYSGCPYLHRRGKRYFAIGLAQMPIGRVVSARCWKTQGSWTVGPVKLTGRKLLVNAAVFDSLRVTILDERGQEIPGYRSKLVRGNNIEIPVRWEGDKDLSTLGRRPVNLRFELNDSEVFAFKCE